MYALQEAGRYQNNASVRRGGAAPGVQPHLSTEEQIKAGRAARQAKRQRAKEQAAAGKKVGLP